MRYEWQEWVGLAAPAGSRRVIAAEPAPCTAYCHPLFMAGHQPDIARLNGLLFYNIEHGSRRNLLIHYQWYEDITTSLFTDVTWGRRNKRVRVACYIVSLSNYLTRRGE